NDALTGDWEFAIDPVKIGEKQKWFDPSSPPERSDKTTVPHSFSVDERYHGFTGTAWYFKSFDANPLPGGDRAILKFDAVFYKSKIWLNGKQIGEHEGGYTPFKFDITESLAAKNFLVVQVNNEWDTTTIPGAKTEVDYESSSTAQLFPWLNYGGIIRPVTIEIRAAGYIDKVKIGTDPDLKKKTANISVQAYIINKTPDLIKSSALQLALYDGDRKIPAKFKVTGGDIGSQRDGIVTAHALLSKDVNLWSIDNPHLYRMECILGKDTVNTSIGIRKVEVQGMQLLLNGEPIRLGGCNRPLDIPGYGSMEPQALLEKDMILLKSGGMELSRISHYPVPPQLLDWADQHGLLIITEAGNWQLTPKQMADEVIRKKFKSQMTEMIERDWNHPSVIAYSVGNEYQSQTTEGKAWTKDMYDFAKSLDNTRLVTFASMIVWRDYIKKPEDEASQYVDFISANMYGGYKKNVQHIHELYPDKPIYISEFGIRADAVKSEEERVIHLKNAVSDFRQFDFVIGASVWTFNDYKSRFPGTNANGYRPWGLVDPERTPRQMYYTWQEEFAPATLEVKRTGTRLAVSISCRTDFPSYIMRNYHVKFNSQAVEIPLLKPGETKEILFDVRSSDSGDVIELIKPGGFVVLKKKIQ
ncbi:MAG: beta-galactosidase, partial [Marivirga sp.]|nr:beta-galactosidase [Marivirga sp.]